MNRGLIYTNLACLVSSDKTTQWLEALGYAEHQQNLYTSDQLPSASHAYRGEVEELLDKHGPIRATAVFGVEGVPTICFIDGNAHQMNTPQDIDLIREKIWNQNLISIILIMQDRQALATSVSQKAEDSIRLDLSTATDTGPFSARDLEAGDLFYRYQHWFEPEHRVDRVLLKNLQLIVGKLVEFQLTKLDAQYLMAQTLFISYLEHREIIAQTYRQKHSLEPFQNLIKKASARGIAKLLKRLKRDFNGDFLDAETSDSTLWATLPPEAFSLLNDFLEHTDLESKQQSLWNYDFRYIPVELISGIYESFLSEEKKNVGAYYTPRHLANLAIDCAFNGSKDILKECIYDGACGSGILLTTAYRRMLSYARAKQGKALSFSERCGLLESNIFGSDINESACRVTAFSLYLSMLEGLQPSDIAELQENENVKLPSVSKKNIIGGKDRGDFFSNKNPHATSNKFTILISNPPWVEPKKGEWLGSDSWAQDNKIKIPRRQTAGAFMMRAKDALRKDGKLCLILPTSIAAGSTSCKFFGQWLQSFQLKTLINFGDLRKILFDTAKQPCMIALASPRPYKQVGLIPGNETFEYWSPKADVSFAFGRLSLHSNDRQQIQTQLIIRDNEPLTTLFWGTDRDIATITSLRLNGTLESLIGKGGSFPTRKGFHKHDASVLNPIKPNAIQKIPFLDAKHFYVDGPTLDESVLVKFPSSIKTITRLPKELLTIFKGPKVVFTDGITSDRKIRAAFSNKAFSFSSSIGVISGKTEDESLLRFLSAYLHSSIAQYVLLLTAYQINFERERVTLQNIKQLPFLHPDDHPDPELAWSIVKKIADCTIQDEGSPSILNANTLVKANQKRNKYFYKYFRINKSQIQRIEEICTVVAPNLQPSSISFLNTELQKRPSRDQISDYAQGLALEIEEWSRARNGKGRVQTDVKINTQSICGPLGIVKIAPSIKSSAKRGAISTEVSDKAVGSLLNKLNALNLLPIKNPAGISYIADSLIQVDSTFYLVKPLVSRLWLLSEASKDATKIVNAVLSGYRDEGMG